MCQLFGFHSAKRCQINDYLKEFYTHSEEHPHGWGLAVMDGYEINIEKEPMKASDSSYLKKRLSVPVEVKSAFAHIRYATIGHVEYRNCHPYTGKDVSGRRWTMVHNGTIFDYPPLNKYINIQSGDTDSERILLYLIDQMNEAIGNTKRTLKAEERFQIIDSMMVDMSPGNKLNLLLYDGELMYVHTNCAGSLHVMEKENQVFISTEPLSMGEWKPVTFTTLLAYRKGKKVFQGTNHGNEYVESEENLKFLYQIFSEL